MVWLILVLFVILMFWWITRTHLRGEDLSRFDHVDSERFLTGTAPSPEHQAVVASLGGVAGLIRGKSQRDRIAALREYMDTVFADEGLEATFTPVDASGVRAEWVLAPGVDPRRRTLYIHGGAFIMGSPRSHRRLTSAFSRLTGGAVLSIDYRLMPEHPRQAGIEDCRAAYRWLLNNSSSEGATASPAEPPSAVFIAGDSAGGNLTLSLVAWLRDQRLRLPDAVVALSPLTDACLSSPSLSGNLPTDPMLGPLFRLLARVPRPILLWSAWYQNRMRPQDPVISPVYGDLAGLPPTMVLASDAEMLRDDACRYVARARAAGSPVRLQLWSHMVHVWPIFHPVLPEGRQALDEIGRFIGEVAPPRPGQPPEPVPR